MSPVVDVPVVAVGASAALPAEAANLEFVEGDASGAPVAVEITLIPAMGATKAVTVTAHLYAVCGIKRSSRGVHHQR